MTFLPMHKNTPGMPDLVHHTVKHFFRESERPHWDRIAAGALTAERAWAAVQRVEAKLPARGNYPSTEWWGPPWMAHVLRAHDEGYRPRYELVAAACGHPAGDQWQPASKGRRLAERGGFRLVVEQRQAGFQIHTALYFAIRDSSGRGPLSAFVTRRESLVANGKSVHAGERT